MLFLDDVFLTVALDVISYVVLSNIFLTDVLTDVLVVITNVVLLTLSLELNSSNKLKKHMKILSVELVRFT